MGVSTTPRFRRHLLRLAMGDPELGKRIREARKEAGLSQATLATRIGLSHSQSISNYERGITEVKTDRLRAIAEATKRPLSFFVDESPPQPLPPVESLDLRRFRTELAARHDEVIGRLDRIEELARAAAIAAGSLIDG